MNDPTNSINSTNSINPINSINIDLKEGVILHLDDKGLPLEIEILDAAKLSMIDEISVFPAFGRKQEKLTAAI